MRNRSRAQYCISVGWLAVTAALLLLPGSPLVFGQAEDSEAIGENSAAGNNDCTCLWQGSFSDVAATTDLVTLGRVVGVKGNAVDLAIEQNLLGSTWLEEIRVWMKARDYCRPDAGNFLEGSRWVMALHQIQEVPEGGFDPSTPSVSYGRKLDYALSSCGGYFLQARGNAVTGNLIPAMPRWEYQPEMRPVLISVIKGYLDGRVTLQALTEASKEDPAVKNLMLDTKSFLRGQDDWLAPSNEEGT